MTIFRRFAAAALILFAPTILSGQRAHLIAVDSARALLGGDFYAVPDLPIVRIEDVSYQCGGRCTAAVRVQQELKPNELITITERQMPSDLTAAEVLTSYESRTSPSALRAMRIRLRTREEGILLLGISGPLSSGRLASLLNAAVLR